MIEGIIQFPPVLIDQAASASTLELDRTEIESDQEMEFISGQAQGEDIVVTVDDVAIDISDDGRFETPWPAPAPGSADSRTTSSGRFALQLASLKTREGGTRELERLRRLIGDAALELGLEGAEGERFRVVAGGFARRAAAEDYCQSLKRRRLDCLLRRN